MTMRKHSFYSVNTLQLPKLYRVLILVTICSLSSCIEDLPEAGSKPDNTPPDAEFSLGGGATYREVTTSNLSTNATDYLWAFGDGETSTEFEPAHLYGADGTYTVTLTASDKNGVSDIVTLDVEIIDVFVPITPEILNGGFEEGTTDWKFSAFTGGTTNPFNASSDGNASAGAKWTKATSAGAYLSSSTRYAYQAIVVSPNTEYVLEFEYAIKTELEQPGIAPGGNRIIGAILDGHFADGVDAIASYNDGAGALINHIGTTVLGKGVFTTVQVEFTSNATGEVSILLYGVTDVDSYVDNVTVYPK
jgi:PKD repeat protein